MEFFVVFFKLGLVVVLGYIPAATSEDVELAVEAARKAFTRNNGKDWARATGAVRAKYLRAIAAKVIERKSELANLEAIDCGKPLDEAAWDMDDVAGCFEYYADLAEGLDAKQKTPLSLPMDTFKGYILKEPIGVVGMITPWYYISLTDLNLTDPSDRCVLSFVKFADLNFTYSDHIGLQVFYLPF